MKRITRLLTVILLFSLLSLPTHAQSSIHWSFDNGTLIVSGSGAMVFEDSPPWSVHKDEIETVIIEPGITSIGDNAFRGCENLKDVTIPEGITSIGDHAFYFCRSLTSVTLPKGVTSIGSLAFGQCTDITELSIPDSVSVLGTMAFNACRSVREFHIPNGITVIPSGAFGLCESAVTFRIPDSVTTIEDNAFSQCSSLSYITIPGSVKSIGSYAFGSSNKLSRIIFAGDAPTAGHGAFGYRLNEYVDGTITTTAYYPLNNSTWTEQARTAFGGNTTWRTYGFADVRRGAWYEDAVIWAVCDGITKGMTETEFCPMEPCTRAQIITFLWRAAGEPEPSLAYNPFSDVSETDYFYEATLWAVENGITEGTDTTHFDPGAPCTRAQIATFLYRHADSHGHSGLQNPFSDVAEHHYYYDAVLWAVENHITNGIDAAHFAPNDPCTRAQSVSFLYRYSQ